MIDVIGHFDIRKTTNLFSKNKIHRGVDTLHPQPKTMKLLYYLTLLLLLCLKSTLASYREERTSLNEEVMVLTLSLLVNEKINSHERIVNGVEVHPPGRYSWMVGTFRVKNITNRFREKKQISTCLTTSFWYKI